MSVFSQLQVFAALGIPVGLLLGMALGLVARREDGWGGYGSLRRRAARLGHIAAVALPIIAGLYGLLLEATAPAHPSAAWAGPLWVLGATALVATLFLGALRPRFLTLLPLPATALVVSSVGMAIALIHPL